MKELKLVEAIGKSVIKKLHNNSVKAAIDDTEYLPVLKKILESVGSALDKARFSKTEVSSLKKALKQVAKDLYVKAWLKNKRADETFGEASEMGRIYFEYVYKFGKHPE